MRQYFYIITLLMLTLILNGCSSERGGSGVVSNGFVSDDVFIADSIKKVETDGAYPSFAPYDSLTEASADKEVSEFTLQGLAVQGNENTNYTASGALGWSQDGETSISVATITVPAVSLAFDGDGNISGVTAYFADQTYGYDSALDEGVSLSATKIDARDITNGAQSDATIANLTVDRSEVLGFTSNYMVYIGWNLERTQGDANGLLGSGKDRSYSINGTMIAGIETDAVDFPRQGDVSFIGKGRGFYSHVNRGTTSHTTIFDVTTDVDFETQSINVNSANTMRCGDINDVDSCTSVAEALEFNASETFVYITNNKIGFRGDVSLKSDSSFTGTIDARFYGGRAQELGSTFAMRDETGGYYYGAFGGEREGVVASPLLNAIIADEVVTLPASVVAPFIPIDTTTTNPYENLTAIAATDKNVVLNALAVTRNETTTYMRAPNRDWTTDADTAQVTGVTRLAGSVASLTFTGNNKGITLYANAVYSSDDANITVDRSTVFGFGSSYMAYISWGVDNEFDTDTEGLTGDVVDINGKMLAGIQTADADIPLTGMVDFTGKGLGTYGNADEESYNTVFTITTEVDFVAKNATITSANTCEAGDDAKCVGGADRRDFLDFTSAILSFADGEGNAVNHISGAVDADGLTNSLTGTIDARFYGGAVEEFGGTFALTNSSHYYYGVFGGLRDGIEASKIFDNNIVDETVTLSNDVVISTGFNSLNNTTDGDIVTLNVLSFYQKDTTDYTRAPNRDWDTADEQKTTSIVRLLDSAASLTFDGDGKISGVTAYLKGENHTADASDVKRGTDFFGFDSNYMAYISWDIDNDFDDDSIGLEASVIDSSGAMLTGIETASLLGNSAGTVEFTGKGQGAYGDADEDYDTIFNVIASVDFDANNVTIRSENTCKADDCTNNAVNALNFNISAFGFVRLGDAANNVSIRNLNVNGMDGALDARFYGEATREFGGTFGFASNISYYYGTFGAERDGVVATIILNVADDVSVSGTNTSVFNSLTDVAQASATNTVTNSITMNALSAYHDDSTAYTRASNNKDWASKADKAQTIDVASFRGAVASLSFDGDGNISDVTANLNGSTSYTAADLTVDRSVIFGFASHNMAYISWQLEKTESALDNASDDLTDSIFNNAGVMLAGVETADGNILTFGAATFTGKGRGSYGTVENNVLTGYNTIFDVIASVDFADNNVVIRSENTCDADDCTNRQDFLDFSTGAISAIGYTGNTISGDVALNSSNIFKGTLDARFYGSIGREFGGTFALANANSYYYGAFGANRNALLNIAFDASNIAAPLAGNVPGYIVRSIASDENGNEYISLHHAINDENGKNRIFITSALAVSAIDITDYVRAPNQSWDSADRDKNATLARIENSVAEFSIDGSGKLSQMVPYLDDGYHVGASSVHSQMKFSFTILTNSFDTRKINASLDTSLFGFDTTDMIYIDWSLSKNLPATNAIDTTYQQEQRHGMMITGIESDLQQIPTVNARSFYSPALVFTGKGRGYYSNVETDTGFHTIFDITASVEFSYKLVTISSENTCREDDCSQKELGLDVSTARIAYYSNDISSDVSANGIGAHSLTGTLDARFYGDAAHQLGGTFALSDENSYYYGAFGAQRETAITQFDFDKTLAEESGPKSTLDYLTNNQTQHDSLYAVQNTDGSNSFTVGGLAVYQSNHIDYARIANREWGDASTDTDQNINLGRLNDVGASITFDENGNISGVAAYLSINPYIATNIYTFTVDSPASNTDVVAQNITVTDTPDDAITGVMNLYRGQSFFGFNSYYMAYLDWQVTRNFADLGAGTIDRSYDYSGAMLVGIETADTNISSAGIFDFKGKGRGVYHNSNTEKGGQTIFDVIANVNFTTKNVTINSSNTIACKDFSNIGTCTSNFTEFSTGSTPISYAYRKNNISGAVTVNIGNTPLTGTLDARFYGNGAQELGGTFAMTGGNYYYYGAFGTQIYARENIATNHTETPTTFNQHNLTSFNDFNRNGKQDNALQVDNMVQITKHKTGDNAFTTENILGAVVEFDYDSTRAFADGDDNLILYFADKKYSTTNGTGYHFSVFDGSPIADGTHDTPRELRLSRPQIHSDFTPNYMALVYWSVFNSVYATQSYGMTGYETTGGNIPSTGTSSFTGKGGGYEYKASNTSRKYSHFTFTAIANFASRTISLATDLYGYGRNDQDTHSDITDTDDDYLNLTGTLNYAAGTNNISGTIATAGDASNPRMTGTANAKFYGPATNFTPEEFGGTFNVSNATSGYMGWFGAQESGNIDTIFTTHTETPITFNQHGLTGFNDINSTGKVGNALQATTVQITKQLSGGMAVTTENIVGAVVQFDYHSDYNGYFAHGDDNLILYFADKKYSTTGGSGGPNDIQDDSPIADGLHDNPSELELSKSSGDFGFTPNYMAFIYWKVFRSNEYTTSGYGMTGYETVNIPTTGTAISFTGRGHGKVSSNNFNKKYFAVTANVNFATRNISLTTEHSGDSYDELNFTGDLSYAAGTNNISGTVETAGDASNPIMTGTANAKFYGPNAKEFGGTFSVSNETAGYIGWFGLVPKYTLSHQTLATTFPNKPTAPATSLTGFDDTNRGNTSNHTLNSTAVQIIKNYNNRTITQNKITGSVIQFDYNTSSEFSNVRFYFDDKKYSSTVTGDQNEVSGSWVGAGMHDSPGSFKFRESRYNFEPSYMAGLSWRLTEEDGDNSDGFAFTGFETADIPTVTGITSFTGNGLRGKFYVASTRVYSGEIWAFISADVNFNSRQVKLSAQHWDFPDHGETSELNFTGILSYVADRNLFAGNIISVGGNQFSKMSGTAEAKLYGPNAEEFGGTFNLQNDDTVYIGWFGAIRPAGTLTNQTPVADFEQIDTSLPTTTIPNLPNLLTPPTAPALFNHNNLASFADDARNDTSGNKFLAIATNITKNSDGTITNGDFLTSAAVEIAYESDGAFADVSLYLPDRKYNTTDTTGYQDYIQDNSLIDAGTHKAPDYLAFSKEGFRFKFIPEYMMSGRWRVSESNHEISSYAIVGFEADENNIPITGSASFTGGGLGLQYTTSNRYYRYFTATANVNFATRNINLSITDVCTSSNASNCAKESYQRPDSNFTGTLSYDEGSNAITGAVETAGNVGGSKLTGTAEARFYGPAADEFGGVFNMSNADSTVGYIGWFGARK